jgi:tRNA(Ile)-lysidine synthase
VASDDFTALSSNTSNKLILSALINLTKARQRNVIKYWLKKFARKEIGWSKLQHIVNEVLPVATYSNVEVAIEDYLIRSYRNQLHLLKKFGALPETCHWDIRDSQELPLFNNGIICAHKTIGEGISNKLIENLDVRFRKGGEKLRMRGRPQKSLKKIFQETRIEPWIRPRIPLIYSGDELICVVGVGVSALALADRGEAGVSLTWQMPQN